MFDTRSGLTGLCLLHLVLLSTKILSTLGHTFGISLYIIHILRSNFERSRPYHQTINHLKAKAWIYRASHLDTLSPPKIAFIPSFVVDFKNKGDFTIFMSIKK